MGYNLVINGVYWGYNPLILTFYKLPGTSLVGDFHCRTGNPFFLSQRSRLRGPQVRQQKRLMMESEHEPRSKLRFSLLYIGHYMLPSYAGTITSHCKDPDEPAGIMGCQTI